MAQNKADTEPKHRGRPRAYDPEAALILATEAFWRAGYAGTSLDDLAAATGMNRPSLYAAFGDKRTLYLTALAAYWELAFADIRAALAGGGLPLSESLLRAYDGALSIYFTGDGQPRGCFVICTAVTEAAEDQEIQTSLAQGFEKFDAAFEARLRAAHANGELKKDADPVALALLATATMHTIAIRARSGVARDVLREAARKAVGVICGG